MFAKHLAAVRETNPSGNADDAEHQTNVEATEQGFEHQDSEPIANLTAVVPLPRIPAALRESRRTSTAHRDHLEVHFRAGDAKFVERVPMYLSCEVAAKYYWPVTEKGDWASVSTLALDRCVELQVL